MKIKKTMIIIKIKKNHRISKDSNESHENHRIPQDNHENHENDRIPL